MNRIDREDDGHRYTRGDAETDVASSHNRSLAFRLAVIAFIISRIWMYLFVAPQFSDSLRYFNYAVRGVDLGQRVFRDFKVEYPPVAYWVMGVPRILSNDRITREEARARLPALKRFGAYSLGFRLEMLLCDIASFALFIHLFRRRRPDFAALAACGYVLCTLPFFHIIYDRLDMGLLALLLAWLNARVRAPERGFSGWIFTSYILLGLGISYKLVGIVAVPFVLLADIRAIDGTWMKRLSGAAGFFAVLVLATLLPFAIHFPSAGWDTFNFLQYHGERGIEIESTYASLLFIMSFAGMPISVAIDHSSANIISPWSALLTNLSPLFLFIALAILAGWSLLRGRYFSRSLSDQTAVVAILMALIFSKVLSAQYFVFGLPLVLLLAATAANKRIFSMVIVAGFGIAVATTVVFPYLWIDPNPQATFANPFPLLPGLHSVPRTILVLRNCIFAGLVAFLLPSLNRYANRLRIFPA